MAGLACNALSLADLPLNVSFPVQLFVQAMESNLVVCLVLSVLRSLPASTDCRDLLSIRVRSMAWAGDLKAHSVL